MNARSLALVFFILGALCVALTSWSTLLPDRGADNVFYGAEQNDFIAEEMAIGDFNNDGVEDIVTTGLWDDPECGGYVLKEWPDTLVVCDLGWTTFLAEKGGETRRICRFPDPGHASHWDHWECLGWDSIPGSEAPCDTCYTAEYLSENQGAAYIFYGGDWSGKSHDIDLAAGGADVMIQGRVPGGFIYNAMACGDMDGDGNDELALGAPGAGDAGEVYVLRGSDSWPSTINLADPDDFEDWVLYYFIGRDAGDDFGSGLAMGDLNDDGLAELVALAPSSDTNTGEAYIFYPNAGIPTYPDSTVDLHARDNNHIAYFGQVIYGPSANATLGVARMTETHPPHHGRGYHTGRYAPVAVSVGNFDGSAPNDVVIGAGAHASYSGRAYVIFGGSKLVPGNRIDLANLPSAAASACDIKMNGGSGSAFGAAVEFVDADGSARDDLLLGAPYASFASMDSVGEVFIIYGDTQANLTGVGNRIRDITNPSHSDVRIFGKAADDQFGGHFSGKQDIDGDLKADIGITGKSEMTLIFGQSTAWPDTLVLGNAINTNPTVRVLTFQPQQYASSTTIRFAKLDADNYRDLVFGGYDSPGYSPGDPTGDTGAQHAGQMWVTKGSDMWKHGYVSSNQTWSGNVFVDGDLVVTGGATLTIAAGTDVWAWPADVQQNLLGADNIRVEIRILDGALVVEGTATERVRFLAYDPDSPTASGNNKWFGIWIDDDCGFSSINYAEIRNATRGIQSRSSLEVKNSVISDFLVAGISVAGDSTDVDSLYLYNTVIVSSDPDTAIGVNILGMNAVARVEDCEISNCDVGIAVYSKARLHTDGGVVSNTTTNGIRVFDRGEANIVGTTVRSDGMALKIHNGGVVTASSAQFRTSEYGIFIDQDGANLPTAQFDGCIIDSCEVGVQVRDSDNVTFSECSVTHSDTDGISCAANADIQILGCTIDSNDATGVRCDDSNPLIDHNVITNNSGGITCQGDANPTVKRNKIWNNNNGIGFVDDALAELTLGCADSTLANSFKGSSGYHVSNLSSVDINAICNWWGKATPSAAKFYGTVYYVPYYSTDQYSPSSLRYAGSPAGAEKLPRQYRLNSNMPNPFNPTTTIRYEVPAPGGQVALRIYNVQGQLVDVLVNSHVPPGFHEVVWNGIDRRGSPVASGVYFLQMVAPRFQATHKLVMLK